MRGFLALVVCLCALLFAPGASAQVHWEMGAEGGAIKRWYNHSDTQRLKVGPSAQLEAHVALLPLVHLGAYFGGDIVAERHAATRSFYYSGLSAKIMVPVFPTSMRGWIFTGIGGGTDYAHSYASGASRVRGHGQGFVDLPLGLGVSYRFRKPWSVYSQLAFRYLFGNASESSQRTDTWALGLSLGVMLEL